MPSLHQANLLISATSPYLHFDTEHTGITRRKAFRGKGLTLTSLVRKERKGRLQRLWGNPRSFSPCPPWILSVLRVTGLKFPFVSAQLLPLFETRQPNRFFTPPPRQTQHTPRPSPRRGKDRRALGKSNCVGDNFRTSSDNSYTAVDNFSIAVDGFNIAIDDFYIAVDNTYIAIGNTYIVVDDFSIAVDNFNIAIDDFYIAVDNTYIAIGNTYITVDDFSIAIDDFFIAVDNFYIAIDNTCIAIGNTYIAVEDLYIAVDDLDTAGDKLLGAGNKSPAQATASGLSGIEGREVGKKG